MLGYIVLKAEEDMYIKREDSHFIYKKDNIYVARYDYNDILVLMKEIMLVHLDIFDLV